MNGINSFAARGAVAFLVAASSLLIVRLWTSLCFFPLSGWNNIRLAPSFMLRFGPNPYPGLESGPITTWIYGPAPLFLNLPATFGRDVVTALIIAGIINLLIAIVPASLVLSGRSATRRGTTRPDHIWAFLLCLAVWPNSSLQYIQADNTAVAFGLLANFLLSSTRNHTWRHLLPAAICAACAVWSKQTSLVLMLAQVLWLGLTCGYRTAVHYTMACAVCGLALGGVFVAHFGFDGLWLNLVQVPAHIPYWASLLDRTIGLWRHLSLYVLLPAIALYVGRRAVWRRDSLWLLPALTWLFLLPSSLVSIYKIGGTANSLNGFLYLLPVTALAFAVWLRSWRSQAVHALLAVVVAAIIIVQMSLSPTRPLQPLANHLRQAEFLAGQFPGQIYFPWYPLVTFFSEHRFYHAEDGLYSRYTANLEPSRLAAFRDLPPHWSITAFLGPTETEIGVGRGWGIVEHLQPPTAKKAQFGAWTLYSWPPNSHAR